MTASPQVDLTPINGRFWRIIWQDRQDTVLGGVLSPEGRLHHSGQRALYISPSPQWAAMAVDAYLRADDPPRVLVELTITDALVADLRNADVCAALGITTKTAGVPWQPERQDGLPATSWKASDAVRQTQAQGLIYPARSCPDRWHVVLHDWHGPGGAQISLTGRRWPWRNPKAAISEH